jgi:hypothetical protein
VLPDILAGRKISALAITEPGGGSDVASLRTTAKRDGGHYVVKGEKTFITSGMRADYYTVAVRTGGEGAGGVSLLLIERDTSGFSRTPLKKMGWWASDTATLHFDDCRVPVGNLIGTENAGFKLIMKNFNSERLGLAAGCAGFARLCRGSHRLCAGTQDLRQAPRRSSGDPPQDRDMAQRVAATQAMLEMLIWRLEQGQNCRRSLHVQEPGNADHGVLCRSGADFRRRGFHARPESRAHLPRVKVIAIGGGTEEIMAIWPAVRWDSRKQKKTSGNAMQFTQEHDAIRRTMQQFIKNEINPFVDEWERGNLSSASGVQKDGRSRLARPVQACRIRRRGPRLQLRHGDGGRTRRDQRRRRGYVDRRADRYGGRAGAVRSDEMKREFWPRPLQAISSPVSAFPNPARDRTSLQSNHRTLRMATTTSSTAARCGSPTVRKPTGCACSPIPAKARSIATSR